MTDRTNTSRELSGNPSSVDRFRGCLLGGAVGDALGAPVEFMKRDEVLRQFGPAGIRDYLPAYGRLGAITDDTQMTLFTAEGLIRGHVRHSIKGICSYPATVANAYLRWLLTQGGKPHANLPVGQKSPGWLFAQRELHSQRAPGNTCLCALEAMDALGEPARNDSKGCGGVMRVAPIGLFGWHYVDTDDLSQVFDLACEISGLTHGHPTGRLTAGVFAVLVCALTGGRSMGDALVIARSCLVNQAHHVETLDAIFHAEELANDAVTPDAAIAVLGEGWVAEEALAISIFCALRAPDFEEAIIMAVNHDGDSDSTGSITGNLLGARDGVAAIPQRWLDALELREVIDTVSSDLHDFPEWDLDPSENADNQVHIRSNEIRRRYPGY